MKRKATVFLVSLATLAGATIGLAPTASAGSCTSILCGEIYNRSDSKSSILIINNWPQDASYTTKKRLDPGVKSTVFFKDTDGFYVPTGYKAYDRSWGTFGQGWHKITDAQHMSLYLYKG